MLDMPSKWVQFVDRLTGRALFLSATALTLLFAAAYWLLSQQLPAHGLRSPESEPAADLLGALYFSVVTETTLGFGDFRPLGFSRVLVALQVVSGLVLAGVGVAKITSAHGRAVRLVSYKASGDWIEVWFSHEGDLMLTHAVIYNDDSGLHLNGENFDAMGVPRGFFQGQLIGGNGSCYRFSYSNRDSATDFFVEGIQSLMFQGSGKGDRWDRYTGTAHDFGTKRSTVYEGHRASPDEARILAGSDLAARTRLLRGYTERARVAQD
jgi:Ion channel